MSDEMQQRITQLEETVAHQELTIADLSDELSKQWQTIDRLNRIIEEIREKMDTMVLDGPAPAADEAPPHY